MGIAGYTDDGYLIQVPNAIKTYIIRKVMGTGSTAIVVEAEDEVTGRLYAIKVMSKSNLRARGIMSKTAKEIEVLKMIRHPNIVNCVDIIEENELIYIVLEHCSDGDLLSWILDGKVNSRNMKKIFSQILRGVRYLHSIGISHGDLKPENVLMSDNGIPKLADFGYAHTRRWGDEDEKSGTLLYACPELLKDGIFDTQKADVWALGITLFAMKTGQFPYTDGDDKYTAKQIVKRSFIWPANIDHDTKSLVDKMCHLRPECRPTIDELLTDPYLPDAKEYTYSDSDTWESLSI